MKNRCGGSPQHSIDFGRLREVRYFSRASEIGHCRQQIVLNDGAQSYVRAETIRLSQSFFRQLFGRKLFAQGWATTFIFESVPFQQVTVFEAAEASARSAGRGVQELCGGDFHTSASGSDSA